MSLEVKDLKLAPIEEIHNNNTNMIYKNKDKRQSFILTSP